MQDLAGMVRSLSNAYGLYLYVQAASMNSIQAMYVC